MNTELQQALANAIMVQINADLQRMIAAHNATMALLAKYGL